MGTTQTPSDASTDISRRDFPTLSFSFWVCAPFIVVGKIKPDVLRPGKIRRFERVWSYERTTVTHDGIAPVRQGRGRRNSYHNTPERLVSGQEQRTHT